jgi:hypothetical protein
MRDVLDCYILSKNSSHLADISTPCLLQAGTRILLNDKVAQAKSLAAQIRRAKE